MCREIGWVEWLNIHRIRRHWNVDFLETSSESFPVLLEESMGMIGTFSKPKSWNPSLLLGPPPRPPSCFGITSRSFSGGVVPRIMADCRSRRRCPRISGQRRKAPRGRTWFASFFLCGFLLYHRASPKQTIRGNRMAATATAGNTASLRVPFVGHGSEVCRFPSLHSSIG